MRKTINELNNVMNLRLMTLAGGLIVVLMVARARRRSSGGPPGTDRAGSVSRGALGEAREVTARKQRHARSGSLPVSTW
jgi:hypothetical protein